MRSPIELKLGEDLGLVSQISMHALFSRLICLHLINKIKTAEIAKIAVLENLRFLCRSKSD
jgi:hypothetical protein